MVVNLKRHSRSGLRSKQVANSKKSAKRKRACVHTYIDLQVAEMAESEDDEQNAYKTLVEDGWAV
jgi:hypothetical protein